LDLETNFLGQQAMTFVSGVDAVDQLAGRNQFCARKYGDQLIVCFSHRALDCCANVG
jgi:hypothetical protein